MSTEQGIIESLARRVEELERSNLGNYAYLMDMGGRLGWVIDQGFAMAIQDAIPKGFESSKPLIDPDTITKQAKRIVRLSSRTSAADYTLTIDPDASPSGVPFEVALMYAKQGRKVRRAAWVSEPDVYVYYLHGFFVRVDNEKSVPLPCFHDYANATDWIILPKDDNP